MKTNKMQTNSVHELSMFVPFPFENYFVSIFKSSFKFTFRK